MKDIADDPAEFQEKWYEHLGELRQALKMAVPADQMEDVDRHFDQLEELVDDATENFAEDDDD